MSGAKKSSKWVSTTLKMNTAAIGPQLFHSEAAKVRFFYVKDHLIY